MEEMKMNYNKKLTVADLRNKIDFQISRVYY
jgi:hypothetical protein